jgi:hypothetical protein
LDSVNSPKRQTAHDQRYHEGGGSQELGLEGKLRPPAGNRFFDISKNSEHFKFKLLVVFYKQPQQLKN